jgi:hypothetical protein
VQNLSSFSLGNVPSSRFFFDALQLDLFFLKEDIEKWSDHPNYQVAMKTVTALKVENDSADRGIALATAFNSTLTKQEQKQYLFQIVESHRKRFPNPKKSTLLSDVGCESTCDGTLKI